MIFRWTVLSGRNTFYQRCLSGFSPQNKHHVLGGQQKKKDLWQARITSSTVHKIVSHRASTPPEGLMKQLMGHNLSQFPFPPLTGEYRLKVTLESISLLCRDKKGHAGLSVWPSGLNIIPAAPSLAASRMAKQTLFHVHHIQEYLRLNVHSRREHY